MVRCFVFLLVLSLPVSAQENAARPDIPPGSDVSAYRLPERKDIVSWTLLAQVVPVKVNDRILPQYADAVVALDQKIVKV